MSKLWRSSPVSRRWDTARRPGGSSDLSQRARIARWDQDSVGKRGAQEALLRQIGNREVDIIVGTQMIAKGFDLPHVTTVGVIQADALLQLPDFRSAERAFQLITQVAGRAGRRQSGSEVLVQTYTPAHYAIQAAAHHDVDAFLREELEFRRRQRYPPFTRMIRYTVRRDSDEACAAESDDLARDLARHARNARVQIELLGPIPAFAYRIGGLYQWQLIVRALPDDIERLLDALPAPPGWAVDVDPLSVL
ncbi:MAG: helicase-related protein [Thermomicrobiales bacterium]